MNGQPEPGDRFIALWAGSINSRVFMNADLWRVWCWCLLKASYKERWVTMKTGKGSSEVHLMPGQFVFGRKKASKELKMPPSSIRNRIVKLKKMRNVDIQPDTHWSIITIINWKAYQVTKIKEDSDEDMQRTGKGQAKDTYNKVYKVYKEPKKKILKEKGSFIPDDFTITEEMKSWFKTQNFKYCKLESQTDEFIDYWKGVAGKKSDWVATWRNGMRQKEKWLKKELGEDESWRISQ
jgi:hypothetical protein